MIVTRIGSESFISMMAITYGQQSSTNGTLGSAAPKKPLPVLLIHGLSIRCSGVE
ncbi:MAG: hypothetical protein WAM14_05810 [Candidatus Nitrosopolaris sp.]